MITDPFNKARGGRHVKPDKGILDITIAHNADPRKRR